MGGDHAGGGGSWSGGTRAGAGPGRSTASSTSAREFLPAAHLSGPRRGRGTPGRPRGRHPRDLLHGQLGPRLLPAPTPAATSTPSSAGLRSGPVALPRLRRPATPGAGFRASVDAVDSGRVRVLLSYSGPRQPVHHHLAGRDNGARLSPTRLVVNDDLTTGDAQTGGGCCMNMLNSSPPPPPPLCQT